MNYIHFIRQIESEKTNSLQTSNQNIISNVDQKAIIQIDFSEENISDFLNLSDSHKYQDCSCDMNQDCQKIKTKKDNFILKYYDFQNQKYQCGYCQKVFSYSHSLGGHVQKNHRIEKNQNAQHSYISLRTRPIRNSQH